MKSMTAALVDDDEAFLRNATLFTRSGLPCEAIRPGDGSAEARSKLVKKLVNGKFGIIVLDYRLTGSISEVRAGGIATEIREQLPAVPVVLVTSESNHSTVRHNPALRDVFDHVLPKEQLTRSNDRKKSALLLLDLAEGYHTVATAHRRAKSRDILRLLARLAKATTLEREALGHCLAGTGIEEGGELARWVYKELLGYPGPLVADAEAAAVAGVDRRSFERESVQAWVAPARYVGPFDRARRRWWRGRLMAAVTRVEVAAVDAACSYRDALIRHLGDESVSVARCSWCERENSDRACSSCEQPTERAHYLAGTRDQRPRWADPSVFCFHCIHTKALADVHFDAAAQLIVAELREDRATASE